MRTQKLKDVVEFAIYYHYLKGREIHFSRLNLLMYCLQEEFIKFFKKPLFKEEFKLSSKTIHLNELKEIVKPEPYEPIRMKVTATKIPFKTKEDIAFILNDFLKKTTKAISAYVNNNYAIHYSRAKNHKTLSNSTLIKIYANKKP